MKRQPANLSESLCHRLNSYALAASAAGAAVLSFSQSSAARIVYTPAHQRIGMNAIFYLDVNHDKRTDFAVIGQSLSSTVNWYSSLSVNGLGTNQVAGHSVFFLGVFASAFKAGAKVGPQTPFFVPKGTMVACAGGYRSGSCRGYWKKVRDRYLGLKFQIDGQTHYAWARLNVEGGLKNPKIWGLLTGYAYETIPNKPIITGKTKGPDVITVHEGSLGALAAGRR